MEITVNLRLSADATLTALLSALTNGVPAKSTPVKAAAEDEPAAKKSKVSIEELREAASKLMVKNKAALKAILTKYDAKTVAAIDDADVAAAFADIKKAIK